MKEQDKIALITTVAVFIAALIFARSVGTAIGAFFWGCVGIFVSGVTFGLSDSAPRKHALRVIIPGLIFAVAFHIHARRQSMYAAAMPEDYERRTAPQILLVPGLLLGGILLGSVFNRSRAKANDAGPESK